MMQTAPCPACGREVMRDGTAGLLVCSCGYLLEIPSDLEGPIRAKENDKRWYGTDAEREDLAELQGHPRRRPKPTDEEALAELERRVAEQKRVEEERQTDEVWLDAYLRHYHRRPRFD